MVTATDNLPSLTDLKRLPMTHTVFGLDPTQLHARYWASFGVQVVRLGEPSEIVRHAELFLLLDPRSLPMFKLADVMDQLNWVEPTVLTLRLRDMREHGYREQAVVEEGSDRFVRFDRIYGGTDDRMARVALTPEREIAELWQQSEDPITAWRRLRRVVPKRERATRTLEATVYDRTDDRDIALLLQELVRNWRRPHATIQRARRSRSQEIGGRRSGEAWVDPTAQTSGVRFVDRVWVGAGRTLEAGSTVVGPTVIWDDPAARPAGADVGDIMWVDLQSEAREFEYDAEPDRAAAARAPRRGDTAKRAFDIVFALTAGSVALAMAPFICLAIYIEDGRPFTFGHTRQSKGGRPFQCLKFRSMYNNAEEIKQRLIAEGKNEADGAQFFMEDDPRITKVGKILRKTNLDELPQFWNVLKGEMSVVGPRPSPEKENQFSPAWREARLSVRPGITGLWQIRRTRSAGEDFQEWIRYDLEYVETRSFWGDLKILWQTGTMILRKLVRS
jgi:lipopolysaccharide/colanic/teichoic acid biosynthesis glycosyltransferase